MKVAMTGGRGFLGWHTRAALREHDGDVQLLGVGDGFDPLAAADALRGAERLIHIAGVNRASDEEIYDGNILFAEQLADALARAQHPPRAVVFANSVQAGRGTVYGEAKLRAAAVLQGAASRVGAEFVDVRLPNLFGEHGRPFYNAVTATFCHVLAEGGEPTVADDKELTLLHAQDAADILTGHVNAEGQAGLEQEESVSGLLNRLTGIAQTYGQGEVPDISTRFGRDLFNTYRSYTVQALTPLRLTRHADARGSFFEIIRSHGGSGQSSFSTTAPGVTRGDHFHRRKVERFTVLAGQARISLRRLFTDEVLNFYVDADTPMAVDMPTMWAHNITNTGEELLYTSFWTDDLFDPAAPDTIPELVRPLSTSTLQTSEVL